VDVIKRKQKAPALNERRPLERAGNRSIFQRATLAVFMGTAVAGNVLRRRAGRGRHSVS
jgi:hypothetical protein